MTATLTFDADIELAIAVAGVTPAAGVHALARLAQQARADADHWRALAETVADTATQQPAPPVDDGDYRTPTGQRCRECGEPTDMGDRIATLTGNRFCGQCEHP